MGNGIHQHQLPLTVFVLQHICTGVVLLKLEVMFQANAQHIAQERHISLGMGADEDSLAGIAPHRIIQRRSIALSFLHFKKSKKL